MDLYELEAQFSELDRLSSLGNVDITLNANASSIVATKTNWMGDALSHISKGDSDKLLYPNVTIAPKSGYDRMIGPPQMRGDSSEGQTDLHGSRTGMGQVVFFPNETEPVKVTPTERVDEPSLEIDLSSVEVPDELIDERMKLAFDRPRAGYLPGVNLVPYGATGVWEVAEDYSYTVDYFSIGRQMPSDAFEYRPPVAQGNKLYAGGGVPVLCTLIAKKGFQFDRASVPRIFWVIISKDDLSNVPPLFHDLLYRFAGELPSELVKPYTRFTRAEADNLFYHLMERSGVRSWRLHVAYQAVARLAASAWGKSAGGTGGK